MDRRRVSNALASLGIVAQPWVNETVRDFILDNFQDQATKQQAGLVLGVHHRGTDHTDELPGGALVPLELYVATVRQVIARWRSKTADHTSAEVVVFVASDSQEAVTKLSDVLSADASVRVVSATGVVRRDTMDDLVAIHRDNQGDGRRKGGNVLVDALLLAACDELVHAQSNVAIFAAYSNPTLKLHYLGHEAVFAFRQLLSATPLLFQMTFSALGEDAEGVSQSLWSQATGLGLVGEVSVVDTAVPVGEVTGRVIGARSAIETFRFKLFTLGIDGASQGGPAWAEVAPVAELAAGENALKEMVLAGRGADINHCPDWETPRPAPEVLPPAKPVGVRTVAVSDGSGEPRPPTLVVLRNLLLPATCEAVVFTGCGESFCTCLHAIACTH